VLIIAAGLWAYHNSFEGPFILDDRPSILENPQIHHLWPMWGALSPSAGSYVGGRPIVNFSLAVNYALGGSAARGYHALNLTVHILAALTLFGIVRRTLLRPGLRERFGAAAEWVALAAAVLWMVHPLQTEAVTYVSQRCESLMGLFYFQTLYCFICGAESEKPGRWYALSVAACLLGLATKEVMVTAPLMVLVYDRTFVSQGFRGAWLRHGRLYLGLAGTWLLLGYLMTNLNRGVGYGLGCTWWGYVLTECRAVAQYLKLAVWPHPLVFDYGWYVPMEQPMTVVPYILILAVLAVAVLVALKRHPAIGFVGAWFFVTLAPTSSVVPIVGSPMAEHRMYLPLAAVVTLAVVGAFEIGKRLFSKPQGVELGCVAGGTVVALFSFLTIQRNQDYRSELAIWQDTVEKRPNNYRAHNNLGVVLADQGRLPEAIRHYEQALYINPNCFLAHDGLGLALTKLGRLPEAIRHYEQVLRIKPDYFESRFNLGIVLLRAGRPQQAVAQCAEAVRIKPGYGEAYVNLGNALLQTDKLPEAMAAYEQALKLQPDSFVAHYDLANVLLRSGKVPEAIRHYEQALRLQPDLAEAHYNLGNALFQTGRISEAIGRYEVALQIKPDFAQAQNALARARAAQ